MINLQERPLRGFEVMLGEGGVRAILPVFSKMNDWIGKPVDEFCGPMRLTTDNEILALSVEFDTRRASDRNWQIAILASFKSY
ncbi:hypothetical protein N7453_000343 [Penicillium expansum]|nr:hypothetical protein N7453_000343 [Penicillium expansum]